MPTRGRSPLDQPDWVTIIPELLWILVIGGLVVVGISARL